MTVYVVGFQDSIPQDTPFNTIINTTSRSKNWSRQLSPFLLGPVDLYAGLIAKNVENAWQFSKIYACHVDSNGDPNQDYWMWATKGWQDTYAHRYPMGKGSIPLYSLWNKEKLSYIDARKKIYIPAYSKAVAKTEGFQYLQKLYTNGNDLYLIDFDAYDFRSLNMSYEDVINCKERKMGHAFVLAMMLDGFIKVDD